MIPKASLLSNCGAITSCKKVRAECEQREREKVNTLRAVRVAYAWDAEIKLTRHLGTQMAERRENHPMTLHLKTKCLKHTVLILKKFYDVDTPRCKFYTSLVKRDALTASLGLWAHLCFTDFLTPTICILSCLLSPPEGVYTVIARGGPRVDGCDVEALGLCWREAGATTGIPHISYL